MAENYYTIITKVGQAKIANAQVLDKKVDITHIAVGDSKSNPNENQTALINEQWRGMIGTLDIDEDNPNWIVIEAVIPSDVGGFNVSEVGIFDASGDLIAVGKYPETYKPVIAEGSAKDLFIRMIIEVSNASSVQLKIDPTIAIPSRKWIGEELEKAKNTMIPKSSMGEPGGTATLGPDGKLLPEQMREVDIPVKSINDKTGDVNLTAEDVGAETPQGAQQKVDALAGVGNTKTVKQLSDEQAAHLAEKASKDNVHGLRDAYIMLGENAGITGDLSLATSVVIGKDALSTHSSSVVIGKQASAVASVAIAIGDNAKVEASYGTAIGRSSKAGQNGSGTFATALGMNAQALGSNSLSSGYGSKSEGSDSVALGRGSSANSGLSISIGGSSLAEGNRGIAIGGATLSENIYSMALGYAASATGSYSVGLGYEALSENNHEGILGSPSNLATGTKSWKVPGTFTVNGTKNFEMPHPHPNKKGTHVLRHSAVESPTAGDTLYRYTIEATEANQTVEMLLPDYFQYLNKNVDVWVNGDGHFGRAFGKVEGNTLIVTCELAGSYKCLVIGTRNDDHDSVQEWDIKGVEREIGESWTGETYVFSDDEIVTEDEYIEEVVA